MQFYFVEQDRAGWSHIYKVVDDQPEELVLPFMHDFGQAVSIARKANLTEGKGAYAAL